MSLLHMKTKKTTVGIVLAGVAVVAVIVALLIGSTEAGTADTGSFSVTETESLAFSQSPSDLLLYDQNPYVLVDGTVFWYEDGAWSALQNTSFSALYPGEHFCGLTSDGSIDADLLTQEEYNSYSLTTAGIYYNADFSHYDPEVGEAVDAYLEVQQGTALEVACEGQRIAVLYDDGRICMINF